MSRPAALKVLAGELRGRSFQAPAATATRPTAARRRAAVFDILRSRLSHFAGRRFADLFAGSGAVAIEALSQGFDWALLVEHDAAAARVVRHNLKQLGLDARARLLQIDATRLPRAEAAVDVVFLDPPYRQDLVRPALEAVVAGDWLTDDGCVLVELGKAEALTLPEGLEAARDYPHGAGRLVRLERV